MKYYKILKTNRRAWYDGKTLWPLKKPIEICNAVAGGSCDVGLHLAKSIDAGFSYAKFPARVFAAVPLSPILGEDDSKIRVAKAKLIKEITPDWCLKVNRFIASIKKTLWFENHRSPQKSWQLFNTRDAALAAARDAARDVALDAARDAALDAAWAAAGAAAWDAAGAAAWDAAWDAARDAALDAARDAALLSRTIICYGLNLDEKHTSHAKRRWDVWQRGYGLLCDINGVLYVYKKL